MFKNVDIESIVLQQYAESWFLWVGLGVIGLLLVIFAEKISFSKRETNKKISSGAGLISISVIIHLGVLWAVIDKFL